MYEIETKGEKNAPKNTKEIYSICIKKYLKKSKLLLPFHTRVAFLFVFLIPVCLVGNEPRNQSGSIGMFQKNWRKEEDSILNLG